MYRIVGWLVVTGFSSYGLKQFLDKHVVMEGQEEPTLE